MKQTVDHSEYALKGGGDDAVVFVHGILGSPWQFRFLAEALHVQGYDCHALLLPGHGGTARQFFLTPCGEWPRSVEARLQAILPAYRRVFLVGHSLGGLICLNLATRFPVAGVVLLNVPLTFRVSPRQLAFSAKILLSPAQRDDPFLETYRGAFSVAGGKWYEYPPWARQFLGLFRYARATERLLGRVPVPALVVRSGRDESVGRGSAARLLKGLPHPQSRLLELPGSYHGYFPPEEQETLVREIGRFFVDLR